MLADSFTPGVDRAGDGWLPWRGLPPDKPASYDTPLLDLIEIAPFLSAPDRVPTEASE